MRNKLLLSVLGILTVCLTAAGQELTQPGSPPETRVGVGISFEPMKIFPAGNMMVTALTPVNIHIPMNIGGSVTIEPVFGLYSYTDESTSSGTTHKESYSLTHLGAGVLIPVAGNSTARAYVGPRIGLYLWKEREEITPVPYPGYPSTTEVSETDITVGGCVGGEYFMVENMSLGGEALVTYYILGDPKRTPASATPTEYDRSLIMTNVLFVLRWYF